MNAALARVKELSGTAEEIEARVRAGIRAYITPLASDRRKARVLFAESVGVSIGASERLRTFPGGAESR